MKDKDMESKFPTIESRSLADRVAESIEKMIINREISPGSKLPNEYDLAIQLNVGRSTVREAIKILESHNVLSVVRGNGTFVCEWPGAIDDPLGFRFVQDKKRLALDLCEIRSLIEPYLAGLAARNASLDVVDALQKASDEIAYHIKNGSQDYSPIDVEFHTLIATCSGNQISSKLIPVIHQGIAMYTQLTEPVLASKAPVTHQAVVDAIRNRDPQAARAAMEEHLHDNMQILLNIKDESKAREGV
jgi:DNA-binding FadR family transcriptional regulator